jgi:hypothetical protein
MLFRFDLINSQLRSAAREGVNSAEEASTSNSWREESEQAGLYDEEEEDEVAMKIPAVGVPRPIRTTDKRSPAAEKRRRYPGVEDLDMVSVCCMRYPARLIDRDVL